MMLDSGAEIYIWIGNEANNDEKEKALEIAKVRIILKIFLLGVLLLLQSLLYMYYVSFLFLKKYLATDPTHRDESNTLIFTIKEGEEPSSFTCVFPAWS